MLDDLRAFDKRDSYEIHTLRYSKIDVDPILQSIP
jgi:hypothetical protein